MNIKVRALIQDNGDEAHYYWRINSPFKHLNMYGLDCKMIELGAQIEAGTDILLLPKMYVRQNDRKEAEKLFREFRESGGLIVYDADDDMWSEGFTEYMTHMMYKDQGPELLAALIDELELRREGNLWTVMQCDAITVSNEHLAEYVRRITQIPTYIIPNAIDVKKFTFDIDLTKSESLTHPHFTTIGWAGGARPQYDLVPMLTAWNTLAVNDKENKIKFVINGWKPNLSGYKYLTDDKIIHIPWSSINEYGTGMQVDIGCVCVSPGHFSERKSVIKAWEFALAGAMVVGSKTLYGDEPIVTCEVVQDWVQVLTYYVNNAEHREAMADTYLKYVKNYNDMAYNWVNWAATYETIIKMVNKDASNAVVVSN